MGTLTPPKNSPLYDSKSKINNMKENGNMNKREQLRKEMIERNKKMIREFEQLNDNLNKCKKSPNAYYFMIVNSDFYHEIYSEDFCYPLSQAIEKIKQLGIEYDFSNYDSLEDRYEDLIMKEENFKYDSIGEIILHNYSEEASDILDGYKNEWNKVLSTIDIDRAKKFYEDNIKNVEETIDDLMNDIHEDKNNIINMFKDDYLKYITDVAYKRIRAKINNKYDRGNMFKLDGNISWSKDMAYNVGGRYNSVTKDIELNEGNILYGNTLACSMRVSKSQKKNTNRLIDTLIHELTHKFLDEYYDDWTCRADCSPIFMGTLLWLNPSEENGYKCFEDFKKTETYKKYMSCESFREVMRLNNYINKNIFLVMVKEMYERKIDLCYSTIENYNLEEIVVGDKMRHPIGLDWYKYIVDDNIIDNMRV